jgi:uncharacterized protein involved in type VI secretion and phage assembly
VSEIIETLRAIVRDELARVRAPELATVSQVFPTDGDDSPNNHEMNVTLLASGVELQRVPMIVPRIGLSALPREGDLVLVTFAGGDLNAPVSLGCLYGADAHPPRAAQDEVVYQPPDDAQSGVRRFHIATPSGATITFDDDMLQIQAGDTQVAITRDGDVVLKAKGKIQLQADGDIELDAQGNLSLSAQGNVSISGMQVTAEGKTTAKLSGAQVTLAGMTQFSPS